MNKEQELKERFFALYWGQKVGRAESEKWTSLLHVNSTIFKEFQLPSIKAIDHLELKPISSITDEELLRLSKVIWSSKESQTAENTRYYIGALISHYNEVDELWYDLSIKSATKIVDWLRGNGFAFDWTTPEGETITVDDQVKRGWVKLIK